MPREITKLVARFGLYIGGQAATTAAVNHFTEDDNETIPVHVAGVAGGLTAQTLLGPYSDRMVDRVAEWRNSRKQESAE